MDLKKTEKIILVRNERYKPISHHFYFTASGKDYFFFMGAKEGFLVTIKEHKGQLLREFEMPQITPLQFLSTGTGDLCILHTEGILTQYVQQLAENMPFLKIDLDPRIKPNKMVKLNDTTFIIIDDENKFFFIQDKAIVKEVIYPSQMMMKELIVDSQRRQHFEPRVMIHNRQLNLPYVFSALEIYFWHTQEYLESIVSKCEQYYEEDEKLPEYRLTCFAPGHSKIYVCLEKEVLVLQLKYEELEGINYIASPLLKVKATWREPPIFISANNKNGAMIEITNERFSEFDPTRGIGARTFRINQRPRADQVCRYGYGLINGGWLFICPSKQRTKVYIVTL